MVIQHEIMLYFAHHTNMRGSASLMNAEARRIRVMIVDDHPLFRSGLQTALSQHADLQIVGLSVDGLQAVTDAHRLLPDVILMDINLPRQNGIQAMKQLCTTQKAAPRVIILTAHHDDDQVLQAFGSGATAYTNKTIHPDKLVEIVRDVAKGYYVAYDQRMAAEQFQRWYQAELDRLYASTDMDEPAKALSGREMEILGYVTDGMLNKEIAQELGISQQTVKNHMTSILRKMNVKDRTQAAVTAIKRGWVRFSNDQ